MEGREMTCSSPWLVNTTRLLSNCSSVREPNQATPTRRTREPSTAVSFSFDLLLTLGRVNSCAHTNAVRHTIYVGNGRKINCVVQILTLNCSSDTTNRLCEPCISGLRARSWATSKGSGRGEPLPSKTTKPTTGARCINWISLAGDEEALFFIEDLFM